MKPTRFAVAVLSALALAGCTVDDPSPQPSDTSRTTTATTPPTRTVTSTPTSPVASSAAPSQQAGQAKQGLNRFLDENPLRAKQLQSLTKCPFGTVRSFSAKMNAAGADTSGYKVAYAIVQKYRVRQANNGVVGDSGLAASCTATSASNAVVLGVSASTNQQPTPKGKINGLTGPTAYRSGDAYTRTPGNACYVYWVPPKRDYVLTVVARTQATPTDARCRAIFTAVAPTMISALAGLRN